MNHDVYVVGAGFSANLGFPLTAELLPFALGRLGRAAKSRLLKVISFHFPDFVANDAGTYPNIEELLTRIEINKSLFHASRSMVGRFTEQDLDEIRKQLLYTITTSFLEMREGIGKEDWLNTLVSRVVKTNATIISFNWDLVLDVALAVKDISSEFYDSEARISAPLLLKPHGSLNWYLGEQGITLSESGRDVMWKPPAPTRNEWDPVYLFKFARQPISSYKRKYMPWIIPPTFIKSFGHPFLQGILRECVARLSTADTVYFLGYSMPKYDFHSEFIFRCGFYNQREGMIPRSLATKSKKQAKVVVVNPDKGAAERITRILGVKARHVPMTVATWIRSGSLA